MMQSWLHVFFKKTVSKNRFLDPNLVSAKINHEFGFWGRGPTCTLLSKSSGNVISPEEILKNYGADILRAWVASSDYAEDLRIDKNILAQHAESYRKIRNTFRFILGNIKDNFEPQSFDSVEIKKYDELEQYILHKLYILDCSIKENFENYNFHKLYKELLNFCALLSLHRMHAIE